MTDLKFPPRNHFLIRRRIQWRLKDGRHLLPLFVNLHLAPFLVLLLSSLWLQLPHRLNLWLLLLPWRWSFLLLLLLSLLLLRLLLLLHLQLLLSLLLLRLLLLLHLRLLLSLLLLHLRLLLSLLLLLFLLLQLLLLRLLFLFLFLLLQLPLLRLLLLFLFLLLQPPLLSLLFLFLFLLLQLPLLRLLLLFLLLQLPLLRLLLLFLFLLRQLPLQLPLLFLFLFLHLQLPLLRALLLQLRNIRQSLIFYRALRRTFYLFRSGLLRQLRFSLPGLVLIDKFFDILCKWRFGFWDEVRDIQRWLVFLNFFTRQGLYGVNLLFIVGVSFLLRLPSLGFSLFYDWRGHLRICSTRCPGWIKLYRPPLGIVLRFFST